MRVASEFQRHQLIPGVLLALVIASPAAAIDVQVKELKTELTIVRARIELRDLIPDRFKRLLDENGSLHLRIQAELWESRPVWDRLVYPATVRAVRMTSATRPPNPMPMQIDLGAKDRIVATGRYYLHVMATLGTLAERDADEVGDAVFGRESETNTLGSLGRLVFRTAIQISDYLQSVSAETRSRKINGADLLR
jgi:hypothetical protein